MLFTNVQLKRIANFHGHICPNLALGYRASQLGLKTLNPEQTSEETLSVIVENNTSALDAIQCMTGCTSGNQHLRVRDLGKHKYIFVLNQSNRAVIVNLKEVEFSEETTYFILERKIRDNKATTEDIDYIQYLLDTWVSWLLSLSDQELFHVEETTSIPPGIALSSRYVRCSNCHDLVEDSKTEKLQGDFVCYPCSGLLNRNSSVGRQQVLFRCREHL